MSYFERESELRSAKTSDSERLTIIISDLPEALSAKRDLPETLSAAIHSTTFLFFF